jgi:hypothetical protein
MSLSVRNTNSVHIDNWRSVLKLVKLNEVYCGLGHLDWQTDIGSYNAICKIYTSVSSNSFFFVSLRLTCIHMLREYYPRTRKFVGLWPTHTIEGCISICLGSKWSSFKHVNRWVSDSISRIRVPTGMAQNPLSTEFKARFEQISMLPSLDVLNEGGSVQQIGKSARCPRWMC